MAKATQYYNAIQGMNWPELVTFWTQIQERKTGPQWPPGKALEYFLLRCFELEGAEVVYPFEVYRQNEIVEQVDGVIFWDNFTVLVECKDVSRPINFDPIAKLRSRLMTRPSTVIGCFFSMAGYTIPAQIVAQHLAPQTILLWERSDIAFSLQKRYFCKGLNLKYKKCVLIGRPDFKLDNHLINE